MHGSVLRADPDRAVAEENRDLVDRDAREQQFDRECVAESVRVGALQLRHLEAVEFATLDWVDWFNHRRLLEPIGYVPPAEYEARYYEQTAVA